MPALNIEWTLELNGKSIARTTPPRSKTHLESFDAFICEFTCELGVNWWGDEIDRFGCELDYIATELGGSRWIITKHSDPALWVILNRAFLAAEGLDEVIAERIHEALSDEIYAHREAAE